MVAPQYGHHNANRLVQRSRHEYTIEQTLTAGWLLNELHETGSFKDGAVSQLVEVAGKNDRRRPVIAKQLVDNLLWPPCVADADIIFTRRRS